MSLEYRILGWSICQGDIPSPSKVCKVLQGETLGLDFEYAGLLFCFLSKVVE